MNLEETLLQKAIDSILHGSTISESYTDQYGNVQTNIQRVGDLRPQLIESISKKLVESEAFSKALEQSLSQDVKNKIIDKVIAGTTWNDLPYRFKDKLQNMFKEEDVHLKRLKVTLEVIENDKD